jgi:hypothetical protein
MRVQFALCAQSASVDRTSNRVSIFGVIDHLPVSTFPIVVPNVTFVSVIENDKGGESSIRGSLEISTKRGVVSQFDIPIYFTNNRLARVVVNFQGIPVNEPTPLTFRLKISDQTTAEIMFQVINVASKEAIQPVIPATQS